MTKHGLGSPKPQFSFIVKLGDPTNIERLRHTLQQQLFMNMEVSLPRYTEGPDLYHVTKRLKDANGLPIGTANGNPILTTRLYEVEYVDEHKASLTVNIIAQNIFHQ